MKNSDFCQFYPAQFLGVDVGNDLFDFLAFGGELLYGKGAATHLGFKGGLALLQKRQVGLYLLFLALLFPRKFLFVRCRSWFLAGCGGLLG